MEIPPIVSRIYRGTVRPYLPSKYAVKNGVAIPGGAKLFDLDIRQANYEAELVGAIRCHVTCGDVVIVVGGGKGVSTVAAARAVGVSGSVLTYEPSARQAEAIRAVCDHNEVADRTNVIHAAVGPISDDARDRYEIESGYRQIEPASLRECDGLVLDCEGAEIPILESYQHSPRTCIVERHGELGASYELTERLLEQIGHDVVSREMEYEPLDAEVLATVAR